MNHVNHIMYVYLYDNFLKQKKHESTVKAIETRLTDFEIAGKIIRLQNFVNTQAVIDEEIIRGATVIVIVGNDETFGRVLSRGAACKTLFGFLPVGPKNSIANVLGIPVGEESCDVLSQRRKINLDIGWISNRNRYFISQLHIPPSDISVEYDEKFKVKGKYKKMELVVCNLQPFVWNRKGKGDFIVHPQDGKLEALLRPMSGRGMFKDKYEEPSVFPFEEMMIVGNKPFLVEADGTSTKETKIVVKLAKNRIEMIVGGDRKF